MVEAVSTLLSIRGLNKSFGGVHALSGVDLDVLPGEIHGLLGENGSGKSTLMKVLAGYHDPEAGRLVVRGSEVPLPLSPGQFQSLRIAFVHQDLGLIPTMTVYENLMLGDLASRSGMRRISWRDERRLAEAILARYDIDLDVTAPIHRLRPVQQALVAIVRAIDPISSGLVEGGHGDAVLCLDEPTAFLPRHEVDQLFDLVRRIAKTGAGVIFVSHDLDEVRRITDRVTILRNGVNVGTYDTCNTSVHDLTQLIVGHELAAMSNGSTHERATQAVVSVQDLCSDSLDHVSFEVRAGEVLGVTGLVGSGFDDVVYSLMGASHVSSGKAILFGSPIDLKRLRPGDAIVKGIALVPGDRQREGSIASLPMWNNMMQLSIGRYFRRGFLNNRRMRRMDRSLAETSRKAS
jgi:ribose transport system ATP-binding protein